MRPGRTGWKMALRMLPAFLAAVVLSFSFPAVWLAPVSRIAGLLINATFPYVEEMQVHSEGMSIVAKGKIDLPMTLKSGEQIPLTPGDWRKHGSQTLNVLIVAVAVWAAPAVGLRRRWLVFPVMLAAAALASGFDIAVEMLEVTLRTIGAEWAPSLPLASTQENVDVFLRVEGWFNRIKWIKAYNDGGGRLFSALLAGLVGYAIPARKAS